MYERIENWDQAASCYIRLKNWTKVGEYATYITSTKIHAQYAKVKLFNFKLLFGSKFVTISCYKTGYGSNGKL